MSCRLTEIEKRLKAATPGPWGIDTAGCIGDYRHPPITRVVIGADVLIARIVDYRDARNEDLIAHAPTDLALLVRLVRSVAAGSCTCAPEPWSDGRRPDSRILIECWPCRIRRDIGGAK